METKLRELYGQLEQQNWFCELNDLKKRDVLIRKYIEVQRQTNKFIKIINNSVNYHVSTTDECMINGLSPVNESVDDSNDEDIEPFESKNQHKEVVLEEKQTFNLIKAEYSVNLSKKKIIGYRCQYPGCDYTQRQKSRVQTHVNLTHTGKLTFKCKYCELCFIDNHQRNKHKKTHQNSSGGQSSVINF